MQGMSPPVMKGVENHQSNIDHSSEGSQIDCKVTLGPKMSKMSKVRRTALRHSPPGHGTGCNLRLTGSGHLSSTVFHGFDSSEIDRIRKAAQVHAKLCLLKVAGQ